VLGIELEDGGLLCYVNRRPLEEVRMMARHTGYFQQGSRKLKYRIHDETFSHGFSKASRDLSRVLREKIPLLPQPRFYQSLGPLEPCFNTAGV
jgi:hypothetical protein